MSMFSILSVVFKDIIAKD